VTEEVADEEVKVYTMNGSECKNSPFQQMNLRKIIKEVLTQERATSSQRPIRALEVMHHQFCGCPDLPLSSKTGGPDPVLHKSHGGAKSPTQTEDEIIVDSIEEENWETVSYSKRKVPTSPHQ
jgi:hypothetical protein